MSLELVDRQPDDLAGDEREDEHTYSGEDAVPEPAALRGRRALRDQGQFEGHLTSADRGIEGRPSCPVQVLQIAAIGRTAPGVHTVLLQEQHRIGAFVEGDIDPGPTAPTRPGRSTRHDQRVAGQREALVHHRRDKVPGLARVGGLDPDSPSRETCSSGPATSLE